MFKNLDAAIARALGHGERDVPRVRLAVLVEVDGADRAACVEQRMAAAGFGN